MRPFVLYTYRHTFLTRLGQSGCDVWMLLRSRALPSCSCFSTNSGSSCQLPFILRATSSALAFTRQSRNAASLRASRSTARMALMIVCAALLAVHFVPMAQPCAAGDFLAVLRLFGLHVKLSTLSSTWLGPVGEAFCLRDCETVSDSYNRPEGWPVLFAAI